MGSVLFNILAFVVAVGVLVAIHEFGHFWVARRLGVKVLRFSIGFGKPLWSRQKTPDDPEYVIAAIPLGGYVKMLDEFEGPVPAEERHMAFNRQSLWVRSAVVAAGPLFNFLFAIAAFWGVLTLGETGIRPLIGDVKPDTPAARAGLQAGDEIMSVNAQRTPTWSLAMQELATASIAAPQLDIEVRDAQGAQQRRLMPSTEVGDLAETKDLLGHLGLVPERPEVPPIFGKILEGEAAAGAGLREGDRIVSANGEAIADWAAWVDFVRARPGETIDLLIERNGGSQRVALTPAAHVQNDQVIGRIGASNQPVPGLMERYQVTHSLGPLEAVPAAMQRTWEYSVLTLKVIWRVLTGQASIHNLSGPITIADAAGKTASIGFVYFLKFLAIVSISLGVLNLLPVPVLDGGHLLYFAIEAIKGSPLSEAAMIQGQKIGLIMLFGLMTLAFYVDILRVLS
jgi:regulator of sigma E protease